VGEHPLTGPKWTLPEASTLSRMTHRAVTDRIRRNHRALAGSPWADVVNAHTLELLSERDVAEIERTVVPEFMAEAGRPLLAAAEISVLEQPGRYVLRSTWEAGRERAAGPAGLPPGVLGTGDNVFRSDDVEGEVLVLREVAEIARLLQDGVPEGTIGVIDDSGGTLTAPVLPDLAAVLCRAGTVRSHLAIIAREFRVPVLMGTVLARELRNGERIRVRYSVPAQNPDAYHGGEVGPRAVIEEVPG
jgi:phosphohistidine swiveling domain-containing protein